MARHTQVRLRRITQQSMGNSAEGCWNIMNKYIMLITTVFGNLQISLSYNEQSNYWDIDTLKGNICTHRDTIQTKIGVSHFFIEIQHFSKKTNLFNWVQMRLSDKKIK